MPVRSSSARWQGTIRDGDGEIAFGSGSWSGPYTYRSRLEESEPSMSNPEELMAASHAGCFTMALVNNMEQESVQPETVETEAECHLEMDEEQGPTITRMELTTEVRMPDGADIERQQFDRLAREAKEGCPVSRALAGVDIRLDASLDA